METMRAPDPAAHARHLTHRVKEIEQANYRLSVQVKTQYDARMLAEKYRLEEKRRADALAADNARLEQHLLDQARRIQDLCAAVTQLEQQVEDLGGTP